SRLRRAGWRENTIDLVRKRQATEQYRRERDEMRERVVDQPDPARPEERRPPSLRRAENAARVQRLPRFTVVEVPLHGAVAAIGLSRLCYFPVECGSEFSVGDAHGLAPGLEVACGEGNEFDPEVEREGHRAAEETDASHTLDGELEG